MFLKFSNADLLEAQIAVAGGGLMKSAHKAVFNYEPREGYLYVRSRAISNRTNDNYDTWPDDELRQAWSTFIGKPVFVNHHNDDVRRKRGVIIDAALHEDIGPDGRPDIWIEVLMEIDAIRFPRLAEAILNHDIERTSMGADVGESECSYCGNVATTPSTYCAHIKSFKGRRLARRNPDGTEEEVLVHEICIAQGEMVSTLRGLVPIEGVVVGDMALTRAGWRRVTDARQTGVRPTVKITLSDGTTLRCTEDHLIATAAGWTPAVSLLVGDVHAEAAMSVGSLAGIHVGVLYGELVTSLAVGLEGVAVVESVGDGVNRSEMARVDAVALSADVVDFDPLEIMPEKVHHSSVNQSFVVRVATDAPVPIGGSRALPDHALVLDNSPGEQSFQFVQAVCVSPDATVPVYDLTVDGEHEFVANGIVVHNCRKISFFENSVLVEPPADPTALTLGVDARGLASLPEFAHMRPKAESGYVTDNWDASIAEGSKIHLSEVRNVDPDACPASGTGINNPKRLLYMNCPECGKRLGTGRGSWPKHKAIQRNSSFEEEVQEEMTKMATKNKRTWRKTAGALDYGPMAPGRDAGTRWEGIASLPNSRAYKVVVLWSGDEAPLLSGVFDSEERAQEWAQMCVEAGGINVTIENAGTFTRVSKTAAAPSVEVTESKDYNTGYISVTATIKISGPDRTVDQPSDFWVIAKEWSTKKWTVRAVHGPWNEQVNGSYYYSDSLADFEGTKSEAKALVTREVKKAYAAWVAGGQPRTALGSKMASMVTWNDDPTSLTATKDGFTVNQIAYDGQHALIVFGEPGHTFFWTVEDRNTSDYVADGTAMTLERAKRDAEEAHLKASGGQLGMFGSIKTAWGETKAPPQVNTLGLSECPVCATTNQFDSTGRCMTCGHLPAPEPFREPDLEVAQKVDMRDGWVNPNLLSAPAFVPPADGGAGGEENSDGKQPPTEDADPVQKASSATEVVEGLEGDTMRPAAAIIASQEQQIARLSAENAVLRRRAGLVRTADEENPAQPVPEPAAQAPAQSTDEARAADATTEVTTPGSALTDVAPMTTTDVTAPGAAATDVAPDATQDVTAPVAGGAEMPSYEQSVTLVQPDASGASNGTDRTNAFDEDNSWVQQANAVRARTFACLRLAKLRIQAGLENDDDLVIAQRIEASKPSDDAIRTEIRTLTAVIQRQASSAPRRREAARTAPSLASTGSPIVSTGSASSFEADPVLW